MLPDHAAGFAQATTVERVTGDVEERRAGELWVPLAVAAGQSVGQQRDRTLQVLRSSSVKALNYKHARSEMLGSCFLVHPMCGIEGFEGCSELPLIAVDAGLDLEER